MDKASFLKGLTLLFLAITVGFFIIDHNVLMSESIWIYDKGSLLGMEIRSIVNNESIHTIIDDMIQEFGLDKSKVAYFRLDSLIWALDPVEIAEGIINFKMPYNLSVSIDKQSFRTLKRFVLPVFMPKNYHEIEKILGDLEGVEFHAKHYYIADSFWWYLSFRVNNSEMNLSINIKKDGWLDGYEVKVTRDNISELLNLVWNGTKEVIYTPEVNNIATHRAVATGLIIATAILGGLWLRTRIYLRLSDKELREALYVAKKRMENYKEIYSLIWRISCIGSVMIGLLAAYGTVVMDSDIFVVFLLIYAIAIVITLLIIGAWMSNLRKLARFKSEEIFVGTSSIVPMVIAIVTWFLGLLTFSHIFAPENLGFGITFTITTAVIITPLILLMTKLINPKNEIEKASEEIFKYIEELKEKP